MTKASRIPFVLVPLPDPAMKEAAIFDRLIAHWLKLRSRSVTETLAPRQAGTGTDSLLDRDNPAVSNEVPTSVRRRIRTWAERIAAYHARNSSLAHLSKEDLARVEQLGRGATVAGIATTDKADELAASLHADFPWMAEATTIVWNAMRRSALAGEIGFRLEPLVLDGPPGIGKSSWARALARLLGVEGMVLDATGEQASFGITGLQKGWSGSTVGRPLDLILRTQGANPIFVIDEIDKAGAARSSKDASFGLAEALLPFLEKSSAASWNCPTLRLPFDMSWIAWVLTSNNMNVLPDSLINRCTVVRLQDLTLAQLQAFADREGRRRGLQEMSIDAVKHALASAIKQGMAPNLRTVTRRLDHALVLESRPRWH